MEIGVAWNCLLHLILSLHIIHSAMLPCTNLPKRLVAFASSHFSPQIKTRIYYHFRNEATEIRAIGPTTSCQHNKQYFIYYEITLLHSQPTLLDPNLLQIVTDSSSLSKITLNFPFCVKLPLLHTEKRSNT